MITIADQLLFPEGPVALPDGSVLVCEIGGERITKIGREGKKSIVAEVRGGPNGAALGPDGMLYICNNGGMLFGDHPSLPITVPVGVPKDYKGGSIQRLNLHNGFVSTLFTEVNGHQLCAPNDIVFDGEGGFWFTDHGKVHARYRDRGSVCYVSPIGSISEAVFPLDAPNGIGLSPDGTCLYVTESYTAMLWAFELSEPGIVKRQHSLLPHGGHLLYRAPGLRYFDSLAVRSDGAIVIGTIGDAGLTIVSPGGDVLGFIRTDDIYTTNICFSPVTKTVAYVTLSGSGKLVSTELCSASLTSRLGGWV